MKKTKQTPRDIFVEAIQQGSNQGMRDYLDAACADDVNLRSEVEELLAAHRQAGRFMGDFDPAVETQDEYAVLEIIGQQIGPYKLREKIGEGGFGVVYVAEQKEPVSRKVALKVIKPGMDSKDIIARFEAERQALAMMNHPNVAKVLDAGSTDSGHPYFVMELVHGVAITEYCDAKKLTYRQRLELFIDVCHAVQHAHQKGIIHRDIKPSNVMVTMADHRPVVKVIDFGVAKALHHDLTDKSIYTGYGQMIGTPMYMSPEQAELSSLDVDTRSDIYSLGVLLYEILTGTTPFDKETFKQAGFDELRRLIREVEPRRPSEQVSTLKAEQISTISETRKLDRGLLSKSLRGDLDWIVMKALEKNRSRRYETANSLGEDLNRYLNDEPVIARPPSPAYRFRKFAMRNKAGLAISIIVALFSLAGVVGLLISNNLLAKSEQTTLAAMQKANTNQKIAEENLREKLRADERTKTIHDFVLNQIVKSASPSSESGSRDITVRESLLDTYRLIDEVFVDDPLLRAHVRAQFGKFLHSIGEYEIARSALEDALVVFSDELGEDHLYAIETRLDLIDVYRELNEVDAGLAASLRSVAITDRHCGENHRDTVRSLFRLGTIYSRRRQLPEAIETLQTAVDRSRVGDFSELEALSMMELGNVYFYQKELAQAESNWLDALHGFRESDDRSNVLLTNINLAKLYWSAGRRQESIDLSLETVDEMIDVYGLQHPLTIAALQDLGANQFKNNETKSATNTFHRLIEATTARYGHDHERTALAMTDLGTVLRSAGELEKSTEWLQKALAIFEKNLAPNHPRLVRTLSSLAQSCTEQGKYTEASKYYHQSIELRREMLMESPGNTSHKVSLGGVCCNFGLLLRDKLNRTEEAIELFSQAIELLGPISDPKAQRFLTNNYSCRAGAFAKLEEWEKAIADAERAIETASTADRKLGMRSRKARLLAIAGRVDESKLLLDELSEQVESRQSGELYFAARVLSLCAGHLESAVAADAQEKFSFFLQSCIDSLSLAYELAPESVEKLVTDLDAESDFDKIRMSPEFQSLLVRLKTAIEVSDN